MPEPLEVPEEAKMPITQDAMMVRITSISDSEKVGPGSRITLYPRYRDSWREPM